MTGHALMEETARYEAERERLLGEAENKFVLIYGHEIAGTVEELGDGVDWLKLGARVGLSALGASCGHCAACIAADGRAASSLRETCSIPGGVLE